MTKEEKSPKKVVEIRENAIERSTKATTSDDDDDDGDYNEYDYNYDDDNYKDDIVTATHKPVSSPKSKLGFCRTNIQRMHLFL